MKGTCKLLLKRRQPGVKREAVSVLLQPGLKMMGAKSDDNDFVQRLLDTYFEFHTYMNCILIAVTPLLSLSSLSPSPLVNPSPTFTYAEFVVWYFGLVTGFEAY